MSEMGDFVDVFRGYPQLCEDIGADDVRWALIIAPSRRESLRIVEMLAPDFPNAVLTPVVAGGRLVGLMRDGRRPDLAALCNLSKKDARQQLSWIFTDVWNALKTDGSMNQYNFAVPES